MEDEVQTKCFKLIKEVVVGVKPEEIKLGSRFAEDLLADSLDLVEMVMATEEEFDLEIPDDTANKWQTVQQYVDGVKGLLAARA